MASTTNSRVSAAPVHKSQRGSPREASSKAIPRRPPRARLGTAGPVGPSGSSSPWPSTRAPTVTRTSPSASVPHSRVHPGVDQVDEKADSHHGQGEDGDYALDGDVVPVFEVVDQLVADARPVERLLGEHRPGEQQRGLE